MSFASVWLARIRRARNSVSTPVDAPRASKRFSPRGSGRQGFALLITITLLAFLVLLLVGLSTLTRVETQVATNNQSLQKARQNAIMALNIAMGELQRTAGPDQRVTATADILSATTSIPKFKWTGVWTSNSTTSTPEWLVSGNATVRVNTSSISPPAANAVGNSTVTLFTGNTTTTVVVGTQAITATVTGIGASQDIGHFGWWVGDEGVKARANLTDPFTHSPTFSGNSTTDQLRLSAAQRLGVEQMTGLGNMTITTDTTATGATARLAIAKVLTPQQLPLFNTGIKTTVPSSLFHDVTTYSAGVLSDTHRGGLQGDLTYLFAQTTLAKFQTELTKHLGSKRTWTVSGSAGSSTFNPIVTDLNDDGKSTAGDTWDQGPTWEQLWSFSKLTNPAKLAPIDQTPTQHGIYPVLLSARLLNGVDIRVLTPNVNPNLTTYNVHLLLYPAFVIANPYNKPFAATTYYVTVDFSGGYTATPGSFTNFGWYITAIDDTGPPATKYTFKGSQRLFTAYEKMQFKLVSPEINPGEAIVFSLSAVGAHPATSPATPLAYNMDSSWSPTNYIDMLQTPYFALTGAQLKVPNGVGSRLGDRSTTLGGGSMSINLWSSTGNLLQRVEGLGFGPVGLANQTTSAGPIILGGYSMYRKGPGDIPGVNQINGINLRTVLGMTDGGSAVGGYSFSQNNPGAPYYSRQLVMGSQTTLNSIKKRPVYWGKRSLGDVPVFENGPANVSTNPHTPTAVFYEAPNFVTDVPLVSLGQLQHFNATGHLNGFNPTFLFTTGVPPNAASFPVTTAAMQALSFGTGYAIGNSHASPLIDRDKTFNSSYYDASYLLNRELFDAYFFSALPQTGAFDFAPDKMANARFRPFRSGMDTPKVYSTTTDITQDYSSSSRSAAKNLLNIGAFNVNSTSLEAWKALFSSLNQIPYPTDMATSLTGAFARSLHQTGGNTNASDGISTDAWTGYRNLSSAEIDTLAAKMVLAVKARGPFRSLSDFVNRRLVANTDNTGLQSALDEAIAAAGINNVTTASYKALAARSTSPVIVTTNNDIQVAGAPGYLRQGDMLQALAPGLTARSDTFLIRTYGDVRNPATNGIEGRAWLEAVVQRLPDYVVPDTVAGGDKADANPANATNVSFGRRFQVISFRWLTSSDI